ncbi:hypothetical protein [Nocardia sp. NRRL S-836]|uniref:hypothetical protein n=1 Tax=Nocardia sp. NRRL S-836 TaxID=1519492 RepID=UPI0006AE1AFB|nr:hypothetical protein [Nocardia sp. NRRL S-836]KOV87592.1 hypothetical protein ADL03_06780 [Nocardia sp. NRRL S-836]
MRSEPGLIAGPVLLGRAVAKLPIVAGPWLTRAQLTPMPFADYPLLARGGIVCAIYLITDPQGRVRWLGQSNRADDLAGRMRQHDANPARQKVFAQLRFLHLHDFTPTKALDVIEGKCADVLRLRGTMGARRWPSSADWPHSLAASGPVSA